jgi:D-alanyl-D-alanine carboxypeptidase
MPRAHGLLFLGALVSLVAFVMGGSLLLGGKGTLGVANSALLYKYTAMEHTESMRSVSREGRVLLADLESMQLSLYDNGVVTKIFPILSKGKPGTPWETPAGVYAIQSKEVMHFSSIGKTWMPYSLQFYGNFFIHGWPLYTDGRDVPTGYSGGCIRLSTKDASEVYDFVATGGRVMVLSPEKKDDFATTSRYFLHGDGTPPVISASSFVVSDADSGEVLWGRHARDLSQPKGLTLLMSGLTALETVNQYKLVRMSELLLGTGVLRSQGMGTADELQAGSLIYPLLFDGSDTAAKVFAREHGEKQFVTYMNQKSTAIGMRDTSFGGALSGDQSTTTAQDLTTLLRFVRTSKHFLIDVSTAENQTLTDKNGNERYSWTNKNPWVVAHDAEFRGGIVTKNPDGDGAMLLFDLPLSEFGHRTIAFVVLDSRDIDADVRALRDFVTTHYVYGVERDPGKFMRENEEPTPGLLQKAKQLIDLEKLLKDEVNYERDV